MSRDWLIVKLDAVEAGADAVLAAMGEVSDVLRACREEYHSGVPFVELASGMADRGAGPRRAVAAAFRDYERSVAELRSAVVWSLVEQEGVSVSRLAREMGITRQVVTRIYEAGGQMGLSTSGGESP